jgi:glutaredoxin
MSEGAVRPVLTLFSRAGCGPCREAREALQWVLEERAALGEIVPVVHEVDVDTSPELQERYGALVPVVRVGSAELPLVTSGRQLQAFLAGVLPRVA